MTRDRLARPRTLATLLGALALAGPGCDQPTGSSRPRARAGAPAEPVAAAPAPEPTPAPAPDPAKPREILGQKTMDIKDAQAETKPGGGAVAVQPKITAKDPILLTGNAYVSIVSRNSQLNMDHALDLYRAETGEFPKTYDEFMEKIIRANNIALPTLPFYQEYGYDAPTHKLVILEYPDRKVQANYPK